MLSVGYIGSRGTVVRMENRLQAKRSESRIPVGARYFSVLQNVRLVLGVDPASYSRLSGVPFLEYSSRDIKLLISI